MPAHQQDEKSDSFQLSDNHRFLEMYSWFILIVYMILSFILGRRNHLYYLIFPFAVIQGPGAYIDPNMFSFGGLAATRDILMVAYLWLALSLARPEMKNARWNRLLALYAGYLLILLLISVLKLGFSWRVFSIFRIFIYIPLYYYCFTRIFASVTKLQFIQAVNAVFYINALSSVLYILNSANIFQVFPFDPWIVIEDGTRTFYRDLLTVPILYGYVFLLSLVLFFNKEYLGIQKWIILLNVFLSLIVLFFTFTRGDVLNFTFIVIVLIAVNIVYSNSALIKKIAAIALVGIITAACLMVISRMFPDQLAYFLSRYSSLESGLLQDGSFFYRVELMNRAWDTISLGTRDILLLGTGFSQTEMVRMAEISGSWMGDTMWPFFLIFTGSVGTFLFLLLVLRAILSSLKFYTKTGNLLFEFVFVVLIFHLLRTINGPGFNDATGLAMIPFALLTIESNQMWQVEYWQIDGEYSEAACPTE